MQGLWAISGLRWIVAAATGVATLLAVVLLATSVPAAAARSSTRPCSSYPTPGTLAPARARVPARLLDRYAVLRGRQDARDRFDLASVRNTLSATGIIASGTRLLGHAAFGARIYLIPAEHLLAYPLAPDRCFPRSERSLENELRGKLRREYRHPALCLVVVGGNNSASPICAAATAKPDALLYTSGTPGYGLVPDGVNAVTVGYETAPPRTVRVHHNAFIVIRPRQAAPPCGVQWLNPSGTVVKTPTGCSYIVSETQDLDTYRTYVSDVLSSLTTQVDSLASALRAGDVSEAESDWLTAHMTWLEIGQDDGAYGCFGALGGDIDGLAAGHPEGTSDPGFTGFHRIEYDLFTKHDVAAAASDTSRLEQLLAQLRSAPLASYLPATSNGIAAWVLRPHEVLEDALRDSLTADDDYGSGTDLASLTADVAAVRELLSAVAPTLNPLAPHLESRALRDLDALVGAIDATRSGSGSAAAQGVYGWTPVEDLPTRERQQIDADTGAVLETLAPVPDLLTSTGHNAPSA